MNEELVEIGFTRIKPKGHFQITQTTRFYNGNFYRYQPIKLNHIVSKTTVNLIIDNKLLANKWLNIVLYFSLTKLPFNEGKLKIPKKIIEMLNKQTELGIELIKNEILEAHKNNKIIDTSSPIQYTTK